MDSPKLPRKIQRKHCKKVALELCRERRGKRGYKACKADTKRGCMKRNFVCSPYPEPGVGHTYHERPSVRHAPVRPVQQFTRMKPRMNPNFVDPFEE